MKIIKYILVFGSYCLVYANAASADEFTVDAQATYSNYWNITHNAACPGVDFSDTQDILPPIHGACVSDVAEFVNDFKVCYEKGGKGKPLGRVSFQAASLYYTPLRPTVDTDGDGMSDAWEIHYGLDPNNASDATRDLDNDGHTNLEEYQHGWNPADPNSPVPPPADTDGDGMPDSWETQYGLDPDNALDASGDLDNDGHANLEEYQNGWNPADSNSPVPPPADTDGDGMPDSWETQYGLNPNNASDASGDLDNDGHTNLEEYQNGWNPADPNSPVPPPADTDGDGMPDSWETQYGLDPNNVSDASGDMDNDGHTNLEEYQNGWNPADSNSPQPPPPPPADTDGDGIPDYWEIFYGLDPDNALDANGDLDNDGHTNLEEYQSGWAPEDSDSPFLPSSDAFDIQNRDLIDQYIATLDKIRARGLEPCFMVCSFTPLEVRTSPNSQSCWPDYIIYPTDPIFDGTHKTLPSMVLPFGHFSEVKDFYRLVASILKDKVKYWQIGSESLNILSPKVDAYWGDLLPVRDQYFSLEGFFEYYRAVVEGILEGNPDAVVGAPGFSSQDYKIHELELVYPNYAVYMRGFLDPASPSYAADLEFPYLAAFLDYCANNPMTVNGVQYPATRVDFVSWDFNDAVGMIAWDSNAAPSRYLDGTRIPPDTSIYNLKGSALEIDKIAKAILNARPERQHLGKNGQTTRLIDTEFIITSARYDTSIEKSLSLTRNYHATAVMATLKQLIDAGETHAQFFSEMFANSSVDTLNYRGFFKPFNLEPAICPPETMVRVNPAPGTKTPVFFLYQMYNMLAPWRLGVQGGFEDGNNGSVSMIASRSFDNRKLTLLFWNFSPNSRSLTITVNNLPFTNGLCECYLLDETFDSYRYGANARPNYKLGDDLQQELVVTDSHFFTSSAMAMNVDLGKEEIGMIVLTDTNIKNEGFENWHPATEVSTLCLADDFTSCGLDEGTDIAKRSTDAHSGHYSQKITNNEWDEGIYYAYWIPVEAGQMYDISAWAKIAQGQSGKVQMKIWSSPNSGWGDAQELARAHTDVNDWNDMTAVVKIPATHKNLCVLFMGVQPCTWYLDDLSVRKTDELVQNGGFESIDKGAKIARHFTGECLDPEDVTELAHEEYHSGYYSQKVVNNEWDEGIYYAYWIPVEAGQMYDISAWAKIAQGQSGKVQMKIWSSPNSGWGDAQELARAHTDVNDWNEMRAVVKIPATHKNLCVLFMGVQPCTWYLDDLSVRKTDELVQNGGFESIDKGAKIARHFTGYCLDPEDVAEQTHEEYHSGYYSQKVVNNEWSEGLYYAYWIPVEAGQMYDISAWAKIAQGQSGKVQMKIWSSPNSGWGDAQELARTHTDVNDWNDMTAVVKIPATHKNVCVLFMGVQPCTWYLDDLSVRKTNIEQVEQ